MEYMVPVRSSLFFSKISFLSSQLFSGQGITHTNYADSFWFQETSQVVEIRVLVELVEYRPRSVLDI